MISGPGLISSSQRPRSGGLRRTLRLCDFPGVKMDGGDVGEGFILGGWPDLQPGFNRTKLDDLAMGQRALGVVEMFAVDERSVPRTEIMDDKIHAVVENFAMPFGNRVVVDAEGILIASTDSGAMGRDLINAPRKFFSDKN